MIKNKYSFDFMFESRDHYGEQVLEYKKSLQRHRETLQDDKVAKSRLQVTIDSYFNGETRADRG